MRYNAGSTRGDRRMHVIRRRLALPLTVSLLALGACVKQPPPPAAPAPKPEPAPTRWVTEAPAGEYRVEPSHASLTFRVDHLGFSNYTARFKRIDGVLQFDPANPAASRIEATVDVKSLETDFPFPDKVDFNAELTGEGWLNAKAFPTMTYKSTGIELTGPQTFKVRGDLTLRGVTKPVELDARFNGGYAGLAQLDPNARIGFSATAKLKRSDFGVSYGIPAPGSTMGVGDEVEVLLELEFTGPPLSAPPAAAASQPG
jgi:polyisoprenoid-binding protein YceI